MSSFMDFFAPPWPRNFPAELKALNAKMEKKPGRMADHDARSEILFHIGNSQAAMIDFETATNLESDDDRRELRFHELADMKRRYS